MMSCYHCRRPITRAEADDAADAGIRRPMCADCVDLLVWGGGCGECGRTDIGHVRCDGTCECTAATINDRDHSRVA